MKRQISFREINQTQKKKKLYGEKVGEGVKITKKKFLSCEGPWKK